MFNLMTTLCAIEKMPTSFTRSANVVFQDEHVDTKTMKITFVAPLQVVVAMLQELSTRLTIDCVMIILKVVLLDNEHKVFYLNISSITKYWPIRVLLDFRTQPLMLRQVIIWLVQASCGGRFKVFSILNTNSLGWIREG